MGLQHTGEGVVKLIMGAIAGESAVAPGASHAHLGRHTVDMVASIGGGALVRQRLVYVARRDTYRGEFGREGKIRLGNSLGIPKSKYTSKWRQLLFVFYKEQTPPTMGFMYCSYEHMYSGRRRSCC